LGYQPDYRTEAITTGARSETYETHFRLRGICLRPRQRYKAPPPKEEGATMYKLICAAFCVAAVAFAFLGDPILALLLVLCALVWAATTPTIAPFRHRSKRTMCIRME
jgi:hypothetical protein